MMILFVSHLREGYGLSWGAYFTDGKYPMPQENVVAPTSGVRIRSDELIYLKFAHVPARLLPADPQFPSQCGHGGVSLTVFTRIATQTTVHHLGSQRNAAILADGHGDEYPIEKPEGVEALAHSEIWRGVLARCGNIGYTTIVGLVGNHRSILSKVLTGAVLAAPVLILHANIYTHKCFRFSQFRHTGGEIGAIDRTPPAAPPFATIAARDLRAGGLHRGKRRGRPPSRETARQASIAGNGAAGLHRGKRRGQAGILATVSPVRTLHTHVGWPNLR
jgi:hypothetical protein